MPFFGRCECALKRPDQGKLIALMRRIQKEWGFYAHLCKRQPCPRVVERPDFKFVNEIPNKNTSRFISRNQKGRLARDGKGVYCTSMAFQCKGRGRIFHALKQVYKNISVKGTRNNHGLQCIDAKLTDCRRISYRGKWITR